MPKKKPEPEIELDFSLAGRKWRRKWMLKAAELDSVSDNMDSLLEMEDEMLIMATEVVKSIPKEMLIDSAPDEIDWDNPESFDYVRADVQLTMAVSIGLQGTTKN